MTASESDGSRQCQPQPRSQPASDLHSYQQAVREGCQPLCKYNTPYARSIKLTEISCFAQNQKEKLARNVPKLELDSNSDSANQYYKHGVGQHGPQTSQGPIPGGRSGFVVMGAGQQYPQPQSATHQHNSTMFGMGVHPHDPGHLQHMMHTQFQRSGPGQDG